MAKETRIKEDGIMEDKEGNKAEKAQEQKPTEAVKEQEPAQVSDEQAPKEGHKAVKATVYPAGELAANAKKIFGTRQECVAAALKAAGKKACTVAEAKEIVEKFLKKVVQ